MATVRGIGVAVMTSRCGGRSALAAQGVALLDTESMLLVDDDESEIGELDRILQQRMGADDDAGLPGRSGEQRLTSCRPHPASR